MKLKLITTLSIFLFSGVVGQSAFDNYDIPEYEYRTFQLNGNDLFNMTSTGDNSTTTMNFGADYSFESQSPGNNCSYGLNFTFNMFDEGDDDTGYTNFDIDAPFAFDKYIYGGNKGGFGFVDGDFSMMGGDQADGIDDNMDLNLTLGAGYGRVVNAKAVAQAYAIANALGDESEETVLAIAAVIGAAGSYANTYKDDAEQMYYNDIANAAGNSGAAMEIAKILTSPAYNISDRSTGWTIRAGLSNNYMQAEGVEDSGDLSIGAEYACPMDLDKQLIVNFDYDMDLNEDGPTSISLGASYSIDHSYSWATSAMFEYMSETDNINDVTTSDIMLGLSSTKAILNQLSVTGTFEYLIPSDGNDDTDDDATMDLNIKFTYWLF